MSFVLIISNSFILSFLLPVANCISLPNYKKKNALEVPELGCSCLEMLQSNAAVQDLSGCYYYFLLILASGLV